MALFNKDNPNIRFICESDSVQIYDKHRGSWRHWKGTGLITVPALVVLRNPELEGQTVTCEIEGVTYTTTFVGGVATFKIFEEGNAVITCGAWRTEMYVTPGDNYESELIEPVVIIVSNTGLDGQTVTCNISGATHTAVFSGGKATFYIPSTGVATLTCGDRKVTVNAAAPGQYNTALITPAYINVTGTNLEGKAVTCKIGSESYTSTFISSKASFKVYTFGTVTLSSDGVTNSVSVASGGTYNVSLVKNVDIVLWNGSSLQNGATWRSANKSLQYSSSAGFMKGKKIVISFKSSVASALFNIICDTQSAYVVNASGGTSMGPWSGNTEYVIDVSKAAGYATCSSIRIAMGLSTTNLDYSYIQKVAIR